MKDRSIPGVFWKRGKQIVNNGDVDIDEIDYSNNLVRATVIGTYRYEVTINENEGQNDFCSCPYFAEHGYCKHIAAVIEFLAKYGNPIEHLFEGEPKNVLRDIVQNKNAIDWVPETKHSNGLSFLSDIKYTEQDAFKLPNVDESDEPLMLEVTLALGGISHDDYDLDVGRLFIKLRIGSRNDQKFYAIKNIDSFLDDFNQQAIYQTGGKKRFSLNQSNFNDVDKAFLIFLS
ncbi:MAG: SWIM zinc finger family protein, partial [Paucilactobacillus nenjiangensis]